MQAELNAAHKHKHKQALQSQLQTNTPGTRRTVSNLPVVGPDKCRDILVAMIHSRVRHVARDHALNRRPYAVHSITPTYSRFHFRVHKKTPNTKHTRN